jgi:uncharacterized membrane protein YdjX (TVP38/TMEM64 family)
VVAILALAVGVPMLGMGERLRELVEHTGAWSPVVYVAAKAAATIVAPFSGVPLKAASGTLFGFTGGVFYSVLGDVIGGCLCFWGARLLGKDAVERIAGANCMARVDEISSHSGGWRALLLGRLALSSVYNVISYAAGLTRLPFRQYLAVTAFGGLLHTSFLVVLGASAVLDWRMRLVAYAAVAILALAALLVGKKVRRALAGSTVESGQDYQEDAGAMDQVGQVSTRDSREAPSPLS